MQHSPVRVLEVLTVRYAHNGVTQCVANYMEEFDPARIRCDLAVPNEPPEAVVRRIEQSGGRVFVLPYRNRNPLGYVHALSKIVRGRGEQVVHAHGNSATLYTEMLASRQGGARVRIAHSHNTSCRMQLADRLLRPAFRGSYTHAMACGEDAGEWLFGDAPFTVLPNAVRAERFRFDAGKRDAARERFEIGKDAFVVCHIGSFSVQKNQAFLLDVFAALHKSRPDAALLLVGDGPLRAACEEKARALGLGGNVRFAGTAGDVTPYLCCADAFALPSRYEGLPLTLVEAQCAGLPCAVSDRVTREAALTPLVSFWPIERAEAFAGGLAGAAVSDRARLSGEAIERVRRAGYDIAANAETLAALYESLVREAQA